MRFLTSIPTFFLLSFTLFFGQAPASASGARALAHWDSVAVFLRPTKVIVLINERGSQARLQNFMSLLQAQTDFEYLSDDSSLKISCGRNETAATCTFRFLPGPLNQISSKSIETTIGSDKLNLPADQNFQMLFNNSNGDRFSLEIANGKIHLLGHLLGQKK